MPRTVDFEAVPSAFLKNFLLPDIEGALYGYGDRSGFGDANGAFWEKQSQPRLPALGEVVPGLTSTYIAGFRANRSSNVYGKSETNQMASLRLMAIIKA